MFMENVDGDCYFLSPIALKQFSSVTVQILRVDRSGHFYTDRICEVNCFKGIRSVTT